MDRLEEIRSNVALYNESMWSHFHDHNNSFNVYDHMYDEMDETDDAFPSLEDIDFDEIRNVYHQAYIFNLVCTIVFSCINFIIFLTICSKTVRTRSPSWFLFHLIAIMLLTGVVVQPMFAAGVHMMGSYHTCLFMVFVHECIDFMVGGNLLLMNIEIILTIILPNPRWQNRRFSRFICFMCLAWVIVFIVVSLVVVNQHKQTPKHMVCIGGSGNWVAWQAFRFWLPSILCFLTAIFAIGGYIHTRLKGEVDYSQFSENNGHITSRTEWTLFLGLANFFFVFLHVAPVEVLLAMDGVIMKGKDVISAIRITRYLILLRDVSVLFIPVPFLCISEVRLAVVILVKKLFSCQKMRARNNDQMIDMETVSASEPSEA